LMTREVVSELSSAAQQRRLNVEPRVKRGFVYSLVRAWATVIQLDLQVSAIVSDIYAGLPVAYTTFLAYDEVAHHSGIERADTLKVLRRVDRQVGRIVAAAEHAPRPYRFVVLSDHGQSQGATFLDRFGVSLEELVNNACSAAEKETQVRTERSDEALAFLGASLAEAAGGDSTMSKTLRVATRRADARDEQQQTSAEANGELPELSVMASGCLGLISFPREPGRVTLERIEALYPDLLPTLLSHPGIGFLLVRSRVHGALVMGAGGVNHLDAERVDGEDPLAPYGPNAARHVKRTDGYPHCPDIVVNSTYWEDTDEVAAFEELVGSHGGMGGTQSYPFLLHPVELEAPEEPLVGAEAVHRQLRAWLVALGHDSYRPHATERAVAKLEVVERSM
jgi:Type I phosphodiesterase / nucleotide pyrophosphatase